MEHKRHRKGIRTKQANHNKHNDTIQSDDKESRIRERKDNGSSIESEPLKKLEEDRGKIYGDPFLSHQAIGLVWEGIFRNRYHELSKITQYGMGLSIPILGKLFPADLVAEFLAGFKICRLARPTFLQDSADDAKVYISFSERFRKGK